MGNAFERVDFINRDCDQSPQSKPPDLAPNVVPIPSPENVVAYTDEALVAGVHSRDVVGAWTKSPQHVHRVFHGFR